MTERDAETGTGTVGQTDRAPAAMDGDRRRLLKQGGWHLVAAVSAVSLWAATDSWWIVTQLPAAAFVAVVASVVFGVVISLLAHEWGHLLGARLAGALSPIKANPGLFVFDFDYPGSSLRQFLAMSIAGSVGNWAVVVLVALVIPLDTAGRAMLFATAVAMAIYVAILEWPIIVRVWRGSAPVTALTEGFGRPGVFRRATVVAVVVGLVLWAMQLA